MNQPMLTNIHCALDGEFWCLLDIILAVRHDIKVPTGNGGQKELCDRFGYYALRMEPSEKQITSWAR